MLCAWSCPTLSDTMDCRLSGSSAHEIFRARIPEWVAISYSRGSSWRWDLTLIFRRGRQNLHHCAISGSRGYKLVASKKLLKWLLSTCNFNFQTTFLLICSGEGWEADELFLRTLLAYDQMHAPTNHNHAPHIIQLLNPFLFPQSTIDPLGVKISYTGISVPY